MRKWITIGVWTFVGSLMIGVFGWAQGMGPMGQGGGPQRGPEAFRMRGGEGRMGMRLMAMLDNDRAKAALGLSDQQSDKLRQILVDTEKSSVKTRADLQVRGIELRELLRADKPDRDAVMKKVQEISDLRGQEVKQHMVALLSAKEVLTPEQQKKIRTFMESRRPGMGQGGGGPMSRGPMGGPRRGPGVPPQPPAAPKSPVPPVNE